MNWGKLLARRSMAISLVTVCMTYNAAAIFDRTKWWSADDKLNAYILLFGVGGALCLASILPLIGLKAGGQTQAGLDVRRLANGHTPSLWGSIGPQLKLAFSDPNFRRFLFGCWQLSFFQGLTQTAQFQFSVNVLKVSQLDYYSMLSVMLLLQIPFAALSGWLVDRGHDFKIMFGGLLGLSLAMGCWWMATWYGPAWLMAAYVVWGLFGMVNVAQPSLALKLAPRSDNSIQLSLFRQIGGLVAAVSGMLGGMVLDGYSQKGGLPPLEVFRWMFIVSGLGRASAALWYWRTTPPRVEAAANAR